MTHRSFFRRLLRPQCIHLLAALALLCFGGSGAAVHANTYHAETPPDSGLKVTITRAFESVPLRGYMPFKVYIHNSFDREQSWVLSSQIGISGFRSETETLWQQTLSVPAGQSRTFEVLMPLANAEDSGGNSGFLKINGPRTTGSIWLYNYSSSYSSRGDGLFALASDTLRQHHADRIKSYLSENSDGLNSESVELYFMPTDWRGYAAVDILWFQQSDWNKATPEQQRAILQWVAQGGDLRIRKDEKVADAAPVRGIPGAGTGLITVGAGVVRVYPFMGADDLFAAPLPVPGAVGINDSIGADSNEPSPSVPLAWLLSEPLGVSFWMPPHPRPDQPFALALLPPERNPYTGAAGSADSESAEHAAAAEAVVAAKPPVPIQDLYTAKPVNFALMLILMLAFAIIVGPVNLWVFAAGRKRYRLLLTTPLLSICFCVLIAGLILIADGVGGKGSYTRLFILPASGNQEVLIEEQFAQTGMLLRREFNPGEGVWVGTLGSQIKQNRRSYVLSGKYGLRADSNTYWGNWFGSRRVQGITLTQVRPSRAGFEVSANADGTYQIISGFPATSPELYLTSADGSQAYRARNVVTGQPAVLEAVPMSELQQWLAHSAAHFGEYSLQKMRRMRIEAGYVYASATDVTSPMPQSVRSINWQPYRSLIIAPAKNAPAGSGSAGSNGESSTGESGEGSNSGKDNANNNDEPSANAARSSARSNAPATQTEAAR